MKGGEKYVNERRGKRCERKKGRNKREKVANEKKGKKDVK